MGLFVDQPAIAEDTSLVVRINVGPQCSVNTAMAFFSSLMRAKAHLSSTEDPSISSTRTVSEGKFSIAVGLASTSSAETSKRSQFFSPLVLNQCSEAWNGKRWSGAGGEGWRFFGHALNDSWLIVASVRFSDRARLSTAGCLCVVGIVLESSRCRSRFSTQSARAFRPGAARIGQTERRATLLGAL